MQETVNKKATASLAMFVYKTAKIGGDSIIDILPKIKDGKRIGEAEKMREELSRQFSEYEEIAAEAEAYLKSIDVQAKEENIVTKISAKAGIMMNTMKDPSPSHIAEMMMQGLTMGIAEVTSKVRDSRETSCDEKMLELADRFVSFQEDAVDKIKAFL